MPHVKESLPEALKAALRNSNLGYLHSAEEAVCRPLGEARRFQTCGAMIGDDFIRCLVGETWEGPGKLVWAFEHPRLRYSKWQRIGDEDYPARGAEISTTGSDWTLVTLVEIGGREVLAHAYVATEPTEPRFIGTLA